MEESEPFTSPVSVQGQHESTSHFTAEQKELYAWRRLYGHRMALDHVSLEPAIGRFEIDHWPPAQLKIDTAGNVIVKLES